MMKAYKSQDLEKIGSADDENGPWVLAIFTDRGLLYKP